MVDEESGYFYMSVYFRIFITFFIYLPYLFIYFTCLCGREPIKNVWKGEGHLKSIGR